jgi:hypothetical protein
MEKLRHDGKKLEIFHRMNVKFDTEKNLSFCFDFINFNWGW